MYFNSNTLCSLQYVILLQNNAMWFYSDILILIIHLIWNKILRSQNYRTNWKCFWSFLDLFQFPPPTETICEKYFWLSRRKVDWQFKGQRDNYLHGITCYSSFYLTCLASLNQTVKRNVLPCFCDLSKDFNRFCPRNFDWLQK